ncbi:unnamed protein product [Vicia faba]|uniref:DUF4283 domain-containing protein n=1 Tax=Vicia faba TaxID=3906 RepID=A0AAV0YUQ5_VICFA|nr:unnamed protein product [Vicia faba]
MNEMMWKTGKEDPSLLEQNAANITGTPMEPPPLSCYNWQCVADSSEMETQAATRKTFAQILAPRKEIHPPSLVKPCLKGDSICIKISQDEYVKGAEECKFNLHERVVTAKGQRALTAKEIIEKLNAVWKLFAPWRLTTLGKGFVEIWFASEEDKRRAWSMDSYNLRPGII